MAGALGRSRWVHGQQAAARKKWLYALLRASSKTRNALSVFAACQKVGEVARARRPR
jgi:hypothetical protein